MKKNKMYIGISYIPQNLLFPTKFLILGTPRFCGKPSLFLFIFLFIMFSINMGISYSCSTIIVGKDISKTGFILLGHNEDNGGLIVMPQYKVKPLEHKEKEMISFEEDAAQIPQVAHTNGLFWSETRLPNGASFSDSFVNDKGVAVVTNSCSPSRENDGEFKNGGIKYGLRRLIAERADTAREGVVIAIKLVEEYGYNSSGRSYAIVDKNEGWVLQIIKGKNCLAEKVASNEIAFIPNHYTIHKVDFNKLIYAADISNIKDINNKEYDKVTFISSKNLINNAINKGWYKPNKPFNFDDFDFARVFQDPLAYGAEVNTLRQKYAYGLVLSYLDSDKKYDFNKELPFAITIAKKSYRKAELSLIKEILRYHYEGTLDDQTNCYLTSFSPHDTNKRVICAYTTQESMIVQFRENPAYTVLWKCPGRPCVNLYVPWYLGIDKIPDGYGFLSPEIGLKTHFNPPLKDLSYNDKLAWWSFIDLQSLIEPQYGNIIFEHEKSLREVETLWEEDFKNDKDLLRNRNEQQLTDYTSEQAKKAVEWTKERINKYPKVEVFLKNNTIDMNDVENKIAVSILSTKDFNASDIDIRTVRFGPEYVKISQRAKAEENALSNDVNGDKTSDVTLYFDKEALLKDIYKCKINFWLSGFTKDKKPFTGNIVLDIISHRVKQLE